MEHIKHILFILFLMTYMFNELCSLRSPIMVLNNHPSLKIGNGILKNKHSYYQKNKIISNETNDISKIYSTYDHKYSLIFYNNGRVEERFNQTLKLKCNQDIIQLNIVSTGYFRRLYTDFCHLRKGLQNDIKNISNELK